MGRYPDRILCIALNRLISCEQHTVHCTIAFQHGLSAETAQAYGIPQLLIRNVFVQKILRKGKMDIVCPPADNTVTITVIYCKCCSDIISGLICHRGESVEFSVIKQYCKPVQNAVSRAAEINCAKTAVIKSIGIDKTVAVMAGCPKCSMIIAVSAIETRSEIVPVIFITVSWST